MLFSEEDAPQLKRWIVRRLENTSDADADVLADYVLALLRHDGDIATVRTLCEEEIPDFLKEDSSIFVRDVFDAIQYRSYLLGAPPLRRSSLNPVPGHSPYVSSPPAYGSLDMEVEPPRGAQRGSKKRSYNDHGDNDSQDGRGFQTGGDLNGRVYKQPRRSGNLGASGRFDTRAPTLGWQNQQQPSMNLPGISLPGFPKMPPMPSPPPGMPPMDPNNPIAAMLAMQAMGFPLPGMPGFAPELSPREHPAPPARPFPTLPKKKQRCRDYDIKGFCARGNTCHFEHGNDSIYLPSPADEYDPTNSALMTGIEGNAGNTIPGPLAFQNFRSGDKVRGRGRGDRGGSFGVPSRGGRRAEFSSDRPNFDKSKTTIVVENIPEEKFSEEAVREFFSDFGSIVELDMKPYKRLAVIKYNNWEAAKAAYSSPKVIFDNRFVKVYWFTDVESLPKPPLGSDSNGAHGNAIGNGAPIPVPARAVEEPQIDIEEFARKQQEVQRAHEEKMKKKAEMEAAQKELERRQDELLKNQAEEKRKLMEKIAAKNGKSALSPESGAGSTSDTHGKPASQTEALKAQLAALEAEAKSLGLDTAQSDDILWSGRGRGRGRGEYRSGYRGRGAFVPRGRGFDRGGFRGRGGAPFASGGNIYKLDNRPKKITLTGIDFTNPDKDESLRQYLLGIGEFTDIETTPDRTSIVFKDRFTAEKFMYGLTNGEIPSAGKVEMAWVQTPLAPVNLNKSAPAASPDGIELSDVSMQDLSESHAGEPERGQTRHKELDYDVDVEDEDWGIS